MSYKTETKRLESDWEHKQYEPKVHTGHELPKLPPPKISATEYTADRVWKPISADDETARPHPGEIIDKKASATEAWWDERYAQAARDGTCPVVHDKEDGEDETSGCGATNMGLMAFGAVAIGLAALLLLS